MNLTIPQFFEKAINCFSIPYMIYTSASRENAIKTISHHCLDKLYYEASLLRNQLPSYEELFGFSNKVLISTYL